MRTRRAARQSRSAENGAHCTRVGRSGRSRGEEGTRGVFCPRASPLLPFLYAAWTPSPHTPGYGRCGKATAQGGHRSSLRHNSEGGAPARPHVKAETATQAATEPRHARTKESSPSLGVARATAIILYSVTDRIVFIKKSERQRARALCSCGDPSALPT